MAGVAWRLAKGPIDLGSFADTVRSALVDDTDAVHVSLVRLGLAWEGFIKGVDYPLDLQVSDIVVTGQNGHRLIVAPDAHLTFSLAGLLLGRFVPRSIEVDHARLAVTREADGSINLGQQPASGADRSDSGGDGLDLRQLREQLAHPASTDHGRSRGLLDQLRRTHFRDADVVILDRQSGFTADASQVDLDLVRARAGYVQGSLRAVLTLGDQHPAVTATLKVASGSDSRLDVHMTSLNLAAIKNVPPSLDMLSRADLPITATATIDLDAAFALRQVQASSELGTGQLLIGKGTVPVRAGAIRLSATPDQLAINSGRLDLAHAEDAAAEIVTFSGSASRASDRITASLRIGLEGLDIADLPRIWPIGIADGARPWITEHILGGSVTHGTASLVMEADEAMRNVVLTKATAELAGSRATFTWLDNIPPVEQADVRLHLVDADTLDIHVTNGHQRISNRATDLLIKEGQMRISGLSLPDQLAKIHLQVDAPITSALSFLGEPRLHLLSAHPVNLKIAGGDASASLDFQFPLVTNLLIDDIQLHADAHLTHVKVLDVAGGHELDDGTFDLGAGKDNLTLKGKASLARIPVNLDGVMDFTVGGADQVVERVTVTGQPDAAQLDAAGLPVKDVMSGPIAMTAVLIQRRSGDGTVSISGDLTQTKLQIGPLAWTKLPGVNANTTAILVMNRDRLSKIDRIVLQGDNLLMAGSAGFSEGHLRSVLLDKIRLGRTQGHATIHVSAHDVVDIVLQGSQVDLIPKLNEKLADPDAPKPPTATTPVWTLDAHFDQAILANNETASNVLARASGAGDIIRTFDVVGATQGNAGFALKIEPRAGRRHLAVDARDAGSFLRGMNATRGLQSGHLTINADFENARDLYPVSGTMVIENAVVRNSPLLGKLLQAITLYGLVDVLRGPGMTFSNIVMPFRYDGTGVNLTDAHANNPSLGVTAMGRIGLSAGETSISGTIVPAYFFNAMLGQLPLVGKLFSPEKGGGVFAARFSVSGAIEDPSISINPISALTPGFLRQIFDVFDKSETGNRSVAPLPP